MRPTDEQIVAMEARGWTWEPCGDGINGGIFHASGGRTLEGSPILSLRVAFHAASRFHGAGWTALYGTYGVSFDRMFRHPDPITAAAEAEAWLRGVLSGFRFPWLRVEG